MLIKIKKEFGYFIQHYHRKNKSKPKKNKK